MILPAKIGRIVHNGAALDNPNAQWEFELEHLAVMHTTVVENKGSSLIRVEITTKYEVAEHVQRKRNHFKLRLANRYYNVEDETQYNFPLMPIRVGQKNHLFTLGFYEGHAFIHIEDTGEIYGFNPYDVRMAENTFRALALFVVSRHNTSDVPSQYKGDYRAYLSLSKRTYSQYRDDKERQHYQHFRKAWVRLIKQFEQTETRDFINLQRAMYRQTAYGYVTREYYDKEVNHYRVRDVMQYPTAAIWMLFDNHNRNMFYADYQYREDRPYMNPLVGFGAHDEKVSDNESMLSQPSRNSKPGRIPVFQKRDALTIRAAHERVSKFNYIGRQMYSAKIRMNQLDRYELALDFRGLELGGYSQTELDIKYRVQTRVDYLFIRALISMRDTLRLERHPTGIIGMVERSTGREITDSILNYFRLTQEVPEGTQFEESDLTVDLIRRYIHSVTDYIEAVNRQVDFNNLAAQVVEWHNRPRDIRTSMPLDAETAIPDFLETAEEFEGVKFLRTVQEVVDEGSFMHHCVASYATSAVKGNCFLFHVEKNETHATVMVQTTTLKVTQSYGPRNIKNDASKYGEEVLTNMLEAIKSTNEQIEIVDVN